jgi:hypothetical protein
MPNVDSVYSDLNCGFILGPYAAEHGMVLIRKYRIEGSMFTAICIALFGMDRNCTVFGVNIELCSTRG